MYTYIHIHIYDIIYNKSLDNFNILSLECKFLYYSAYQVRVYLQKLKLKIVLNENSFKYIIQPEGNTLNVHYGKVLEKKKTTVMEVDRSRGRRL